MSLKKLFKRYMKVPDPDKAHAELSASGSERWLGCPASARLSRGIPSVETEAGIRGTNTHTLIQFILENWINWKKYLADDAADDFKAFIGFDMEMLESALTAVKAVRVEENNLKFITGRKPELYVEEKVELKGVGFGTADIILFQPFNTLHVMDYKNGKYKVEPKDNTQGLYYGNGAADRVGWDFEHFKFSIIQPNAPDKRGPVRTWHTDYKRLERGGKMLRDGAKRTKDPRAPMVVDAKYCWFCPARQICPAQKAEREVKVVSKFQRSFCDVF